MLFLQYISFFAFVFATGSYIDIPAAMCYTIENFGRISTVMAACVLAFVGIYAAVLGIGVLSLDIWWKIPLFGMVSPFWAICLLGGFDDLLGR